MSDHDTVQRPAPAQNAEHGIAAHSEQPTNKRTWKRKLRIMCLVVIGAFLAFIALGLVLNATGYESGSDSGLAVPGAEVTDEYVAANEGTTWTVVTDNENPSEAELIDIATALVSLPEVEPLVDNGLDILLYDEGGRRLRSFNDNLQELDKASVEGDLEKIFELTQDFPQEWVEDHSVATVSVTRGPDGLASYIFCARPVGLCEAGQRALLVPAP